MWILAKVYIKLEKTSFSEMEIDRNKYKAECLYSIYSDVNKNNLISTKIEIIENLSLEELNLWRIYQILMTNFKDSEFI